MAAPPVGFVVERVAGADSQVILIVVAGGRLPAGSVAATGPSAA